MLFVSFNMLFVTFSIQCIDIRNVFLYNASTYVLLVTTLTLSCPAGLSAATKATKTKTTTEFGTLKGQQEYIGKVLGRKNIHFEVSTTKIASTLLTQVDILDFATGKKLDYDMITTSDVKWIGYTCDCHSSKANSVPISSYGAHEARGKSSAVIYTSITNLK